MSDFEVVESTLVKAVDTAPMKKSSRLTDKEERFIDYYLEAFNKCDAYRRSYGGKHHSDEVALMADAILNRPEVERKVKQQMSKMLSTKLATAPHWILIYIQELLALDPMEYLEDDGITIKPLTAIRPEVRKFIRQGKPTVNNKTGEIIGAYELPSFSAALDKLMEIFKLATTLAVASGDKAEESSEVSERRSRVLSSLE